MDFFFSIYQPNKLHPLIIKENIQNIFSDNNTIYPLCKKTFPVYSQFNLLMS